jgi:hypothetical protein
MTNSRDGVSARYFATDAKHHDLVADDAGQINHLLPGAVAALPFSTMERPDAVNQALVEWMTG